MTDYASPDRYTLTILGTKPVTLSPGDELRISLEVTITPELMEKLRRKKRG